MKRVGIVGFGHLGLTFLLNLIPVQINIRFLMRIYKGKYITEKLLADKNFELIFVWNRSPIDDKSLDKKYVLTNLDDFIHQ